MNGGTAGSGGAPVRDGPMIFICYRKNDSEYIAGRLRQQLAAHFGPEQIFRDIDTMKAGADFVQHIEDAVGSCKVFLAVIGDNWLDGRDAAGRRRIDAPRDWVRQEIKAALARPEVLVVPVLVERATMPAEQELPASIRKLARRHAQELSDRRWDYDVQQLITSLEPVLGPRPEVAATAPRADFGGPPPPAFPRQWGQPPTASGPPPRPWGSASPPEPDAQPRIPTWLKVGVPCWSSPCSSSSRAWCWCAT